MIVHGASRNVRGRDMGKLVGLLVVCWWVWIAAVAVVRQPDKTRQLDTVAGIVTGSMRPDVPTPALPAYNQLRAAVFAPSSQHVAVATVTAVPLVAARAAPRRAEPAAIAQRPRPPVNVQAPVRIAQRARPAAPPPRQVSRPSPPVVRTVAIRQPQFWARLQSSSF